MYTTLSFLALLGAPYIYDISSLRVKTDSDITLLICVLHLTYLLFKKKPFSVDFYSEFNLSVSNRTLRYLIYFYLRLLNS